jgi:hypothetical protein
MDFKMNTQRKTFKSLFLCIVATQCSYNINAIDTPSIVNIDNLLTKDAVEPTKGDNPSDKGKNGDTPTDENKKNETNLDKAIKIGSVIGISLGICNQLKQLFWSEKKQPIDIPGQLYAARKKISELIAKNFNGTIGRYGLPTACDAEVKKLVFIPGGPDLLQELRQLFESYVAETKANGNKLHIK